MRYKMLNGKRVIIPDDYKAPRDGMTHTHEDGTTHDHEGGDEPHTHDEEYGVDVERELSEEEEELPDFKKMSKKALDEWAEERGIILDRRKTKAHMIEELNKQL